MVKKFRAVSDDRKIYVIDKCSGGWHATHSVAYSPSMTLLELKVQILKTLAEYDFNSKLTPGEVRLRRLVFVLHIKCVGCFSHPHLLLLLLLNNRSLLADVDGALFLDESLEVINSGITEGSKIIIELGEALAPTMIPLRYIFHGSYNFTTGVRELTLGQGATLGDWYEACLPQNNHPNLTPENDNNNNLARPRWQLCMEDPRLM